MQQQAAIGERHGGKAERRAIEIGETVDILGIEPDVVELGRPEWRTVYHRMLSDGVTWAARLNPADGALVHGLLKVAVGHRRDDATVP